MKFLSVCFSLILLLAIIAGISAPNRHAWAQDDDGWKLVPELDDYISQVQCLESEVTVIFRQDFTPIVGSFYRLTFEVEGEEATILIPDIRPSLELDAILHRILIAGVADLSPEVAEIEDVRMEMAESGYESIADIPDEKKMEYFYRILAALGIETFTELIPNSGLLMEAFTIPGDTLRDYEYTEQRLSFDPARFRPPMFLARFWQTGKLVARLEQVPDPDDESGEGPTEPVILVEDTLCEGEDSPESSGVPAAPTALEALVPDMFAQYDCVSASGLSFSYTTTLLEIGEGAITFEYQRGEITESYTVDVSNPVNQEYPIPIWIPLGGAVFELNFEDDREDSSRHGTYEHTLSQTGVIELNGEMVEVRMYSGSGSEEIDSVYSVHDTNAHYLLTGTYTLYFDARSGLMLRSESTVILTELAGLYAGFFEENEDIGGVCVLAETNQPLAVRTDFSPDEVIPTREITTEN
jgi:hypothetical protein